jgi:ATP-binding cassette subfamily F protein 3
MLFVSHNQSFVNRLATKIWDIRNGVIIEYPGTLYEYYDHLARIETSSQKEFIEEAKTADSVEDESLINRDALNKKDKRKERAEIRHRISETLQPIEKKLVDIEERITIMEQREKEIEKKLVDPELFKDEGKSVPLLNEYNELREKLKELMLRWEYQHDQLEKTKRELDV